MSLKGMTPVATKDGWDLYLLGHSSENVRKAILYKTVAQQLLARVSVKEDKANKKIDYIVIEAIDEKTNKFVEFLKTFTATTR